MVQKRSGLRHLGGAQAGELLARDRAVRQCRAAQAGRVGRGAHQQRLDEAALARHVARIAVIGFGIARREAGELAPVRVVVAVGGEIVAVAGEHRAALVGDDLQTEARQFEIAHDLRPEQAADIGAVGIEEAGRQLPADRRAADPVVLFDHQHIQPGALQIAGVDQAVVPGADDDGVPCLHAAVSCMRSIPRIFAPARCMPVANFARRRAVCPVILNECSTKNLQVFCSRARLCTDLAIIWTGSHDDRNDEPNPNMTTQPSAFSRRFGARAICRRAVPTRSTGCLAGCSLEGQATFSIIGCGSGGITAASRRKARGRACRPASTSRLPVIEKARERALRHAACRRGQLSCRRRRARCRFADAVFRRGVLQGRAAPCRRQGCAVCRDLSRAEARRLCSPRATG